MIQHRTQNTSGKSNTKEYIVLHHTASGYGTTQGVINGFMGRDIASAHYLINECGEIHKFNTDNDVLRHAGSSSWEGKTQLNRYSIGIEIIGPLPGFTEAQKKATRNLIKDLMNKYKIPSEKIIRHKDIAPTRKVDIDDSFRSNDYKTFKDYQNSFNNNQPKKMTDKEKEMLIVSLMNLCSTLYNNVDTKEIKEALSNVNKEFRKEGFDNK